MTERPKFFDDLAGVAGGAMSALAGLREEAEGTIRTRVEEVIRKLDLVRREDLEAVQEMAANARAAQAALEARLAAVEAKLAAASAPTAASPSASAAASASSGSAADATTATPMPERPADDSGMPRSGLTRPTRERERRSLLRLSMGR